MIRVVEPVRLSRASAEKIFLRDYHTFTKSLSFSDHPPTLFTMAPIKILMLHGFVFILTEVFGKLITFSPTRYAQNASIFSKRVSYIFSFTSLCEINQQRNFGPMLSWRPFARPVARTSNSVSLAEYNYKTLALCCDLNI